MVVAAFRAWGEGEVLALGAAHDQVASGHALSDTRNSARRYECSKGQQSACASSSSSSSSACCRVFPSLPAVLYVLCCALLLIHFPVRLVLCCLPILHHHHFRLPPHLIHAIATLAFSSSSLTSSLYDLRLTASGRSHRTTPPKSWKLRPPPRRFSPQASQALLE